MGRVGSGPVRSGPGRVGLGWVGLGQVGLGWEDVTVFFFVVSFMLQVILVALNLIK